MQTLINDFPKNYSQKYYVKLWLVVNVLEIKLKYWQGIYKSNLINCVNLNQLYFEIGPGPFHSKEETL